MLLSWFRANTPKTRTTGDRQSLPEVRPARVFHLNRLLSIGISSEGRYETVLSDSLSGREVHFYGPQACTGLRGRDLDVSILLDHDVVRGKARIESADTAPGILRMELSLEAQARLEKFLGERQRK